ncbi:MAG: hypothetical protein H7X94_15175, partial [Vallitaleaceae bacterium]|nr:hypothetical protein [Vallitaleaceae bacterium]
SLQAERLSAMSYGEYRPEVDNISEENRQKNRRVNIVILSSKYDTLEPTSTTEVAPVTEVSTPTEETTVAH